MTAIWPVNLEDVAGKTREVYARMVISFSRKFTQAPEYGNFIDNWRCLRSIFNADF